MIFSVMFEGKTYGWDMILACSVIVAGTILAVPSGGSSGDETSFSGVIVVIVSTLAASLKPVIMSNVMKGTPERPKLEPTVVLFYDTFISFWFMLIYWLVSDERSKTCAYLGGGHFGYAIGLILVGATMAFGFNLSSYFFVLLTSALTTTVAANGVKVINIVISALISHVSAPRNWVGVALVCVALAVYAYVSYMAKKRPPPLGGPHFPNPFAKGEVTKGVPDAEAGKALNEGTPLNGEQPPACAQCCVIS